MILYESKFLKKKGWICQSHASDISDIGDVRLPTEKPVFVEVFSGSGHVSQAAAKRGYQTFTIDFNEKFNPDIATDIERLRFSQLPNPKNVVAAWLSVPCYVHSVLSIATHWNKVSIGYRQYYYTPKTKKAIQALRILNKAIRLIKYLNPIFYFIENPRGALRHMPQMVFVPYRKTVSYADYGFKVYKPTDIFTNCRHFQPIQIKGAIGRTFEEKIANKGNNYTRSLVPPGLITEVLDAFRFLEPQQEQELPILETQNN